MRYGTIPLKEILTEYNERNTESKYNPVAIGRYGIRTRESIYSKDLTKDYSKNKLIYNNTLTVGMGSTQMDIGILSEDIIYSVSPAYHTYKIRNINSIYLRYCLEHRNQDMFVRYVKRGSRQGKSIDLKRWLNYEIPTYSSEIQEAIVTKLQLVDKLMSITKRQLLYLNTIVKSRFIELFGNPVTDSKNLGFKPLRYFIKNIRYGTSTPPVFSDHGYSFIRATNIKNGKVDNKDMKYIGQEEANKIPKCKLFGGEMIIVRSGVNAGDTCIIDADNIGNYAGYDIIIVFNDNVNPVYINELINTHYMDMVVKPLTKRAAQPHLNSEQVQNLPIVNAPLDLQNQFADFVTQVDKSKLAVQQRLNELETLKKSLMQQYFG